MSRPHRPPFASLVRCFAGLSLCLLLVGVVGCGQSRSDRVKAVNSSNSKRLSNLYMAYQHNSSGFEGPEDEASFRDFISSLPESSMELFGFTSGEIDQLFVSERDGQPFQIRYKIRGAEDGSEPVIFEKTGVDGVRIVGFTGMVEKEVSTDDEYENLWTKKRSRRSRSEDGGRRNQGEEYDAATVDEFDVE